MHSNITSTQLYNYNVAMYRHNIAERTYMYVLKHFTQYIYMGL